MRRLAAVHDMRVQDKGQERCLQIYSSAHEQQRSGYSPGVCIRWAVVVGVAREWFRGVRVSEESVGEDFRANFGGELEEWGGQLGLDVWSAGYFCGGRGFRGVFPRGALA